MDVKQLEAFVAVAKYKNFSKAARELFLTRMSLPFEPLGIRPIPCRRTLAVRQGQVGLPDLVVPYLVTQMNQALTLTMVRLSRQSHRS